MSAGLAAGEIPGDLTRIERGNEAWRARMRAAARAERRRAALQVAGLAAALLGAAAIAAHALN